MSKSFRKKRIRTLFLIGITQNSLFSRKDYSEYYSVNSSGKKFEKIRKYKVYLSIKIR